MYTKSGTTLLAAFLAAALLCGITIAALAQGVGTGTTRPATANPPRTVPGMPNRPYIPGSPGTSLSPGQTGMPSRPAIPGSPGTAFGTEPNSNLARPDCLNGSIAVAGC
jgi:hypothetical protein